MWPVMWPVVEPMSGCVIALVGCFSRCFDTPSRATNAEFNRLEEDRTYAGGIAHFATLNLQRTHHGVPQWSFPMEFSAGCWGEEGEGVRERRSDEQGE